MKYIVTFSRLGGAVIDASSEDEAMEIASNIVNADEVQWDDDWVPTDVEELEK